VILKCEIPRPVLLKVKIVRNVTPFSLVLGVMCASSGAKVRQTEKLAPTDDGTRNCRNVRYLLTGQKGVTFQMALIFIFKFVAAATDQSVYRAAVGWTVCGSSSRKDKGFFYSKIPSIPSMGPTQLLFNENRVFLLGGEAAGA
jgi:hypothetical protein